MKKSKIIVPALGILVLSTAAAVTGTVAWFTSNTLVNLSGMQLQIDPEEGIVVANEAKANWATSALASHTGLNASDEQLQFMLTSTADLSVWYHANSDDANSATASSAYTDVSPNKPDAGKDETGLGVKTIDQVDKNIYLLNRFYVQSASSVSREHQNIYVTDVAASGSANSQQLNKALRVAFVLGSTKVIYAPFSGASLTYTVGGTEGTSITVKAAKDANNNSVRTNLAEDVTVGAYSEGGTYATEIEVYAYFEGEDAAAKSSNITATLDTLAISFKFGNENHQ